MGAAGVNPFDTDNENSARERKMRCRPHERLAEFDRLMAEGEIEAVIDAIKTERKQV